VLAQSADNRLGVTAIGVALRSNGCESGCSANPAPFCTRDMPECTGPQLDQPAFVGQHDGAQSGPSTGDRTPHTPSSSTGLALAHSMVSIDSCRRGLIERELSARFPRSFEYPRFDRLARDGDGALVHAAI
jgi:hypothetical protein